VSAFLNKELTRHHGFVPGTGSVDGLEYITDHVRGGSGFSYTRIAHKEMPNGWWVHLNENFPSPFDRLVGIDSGIVTRYSVWLGQTDDGEDGPCPFPLPDGAKPDAWCPDAEVNWYADFGEDGEAAEKYAASLPKVAPDT
jgi:hypothetical protein